MRPNVAEHDRPLPAAVDFQIDEIVLAFHGNLLYEARVLRVEQETGCRAHAYLVHFQGWKKSWDEPVSTNMVFEHNDDNLRIAHRLLDGAKMRQQAVQPSDEREVEKEPKEPAPEAVAANSMFQLPLPLQRQLVDDWEFITKEHRLVPLPRQMTVKNVLHKWVAGRRQAADKAAKEVAEGLLTYFDCCLPKILLYQFERGQYETYFTKPGRDSVQAPSAVYGAEHLLRLLFKMPYLLQGSTMDKEKLQAIADKVNELTKYLQKNGRTLFLSEYEAASQEYAADFDMQHQ